VTVKSSGGATVATYKYDAMGRRMTQSNTLLHELYCFKDWQPVAHRNTPWCADIPCATVRKFEATDVRRGATSV
jgi:hypothetical protein